MEKLIHFLKTLTDAEIRLLTKIFIKQKINPTLLQLYKQLIQDHPSYENLDEKKLANKIKDTKGTTSAFTCAKDAFKTMIYRFKGLKIRL